MRRAFLSIALALCLAVFFGSYVQAQRDLAIPPKANRSLDVTCGTDGGQARELLGRRLTAVATATPISFRQQPAVLRGDWEFGIALRDFTVLGDVSIIRFQLDAEGAEIETWTRAETREIAGHLVSLFNPTWPVSALRKVLRGNSWGWDVPRLYWGELLGEGIDPGNGTGVYLRIAPDTLPAARVVRVSDDLQYSGNVVNVVMPTFAWGCTCSGRDPAPSRVEPRLRQSSSSSSAGCGRSASLVISALWSRAGARCCPSQWP